MNSHLFHNSFSDDIVSFDVRNLNSKNRFYLSRPNSSGFQRSNFSSHTSFPLCERLFCRTCIYTSLFHIAIQTQFFFRSCSGTLPQFHPAIAKIVKYLQVLIFLVSLSSYIRLHHSILKEVQSYMFSIWSSFTLKIFTADSINSGIMIVFPKFSMFCLYFVFGEI